MHAPKIGGSKAIDRLKNLVKAALLFIPAFNGNGLDGVFGFNEPLGCALDPLADDVGMNGRLNQFMEADLELFAIDGELPA